MNQPFVTFLTATLPKWIDQWVITKRETVLYTSTPDYLFPLLFFLKANTYTRFVVLIDMAGVDEPSRPTRWQVVYNLISVDTNTRVRVVTSFADRTPISSVVSLFPTAGWVEREVWDMFGVFFSNHPDLRRILTDYGFEGHPLRKDFPLSGYVAVRYDDSESRVVTEPMEMTQAYRYFAAASPWEIPHSRIR